MIVIIRSRMWLFPGSLGVESLHRRSRREVESDHKKKQQPGAGGPTEREENEEKRFPMTIFLRRCLFPEFRCLFRAFDQYPWASITTSFDQGTVDALVKVATAQVNRSFPVLDLLNCAQSLPALASPRNILRWSRNWLMYLRGKRGTCKAEDIKPGEQATRYEEIEFDDVSEDAVSELRQRTPDVLIVVVVIVIFLSFSHQFDWSSQSFPHQRRRRISTTVKSRHPGAR